MASDLSEQVESELARVRSDPGLLSRYDINGDGELDESEWALVRRMVEGELRARSAQRRSAATTVTEPFAVADRFEVSGVLGRGGQGITYLATDSELGEKVALKKLRLRDEVIDVCSGIKGPQGDYLQQTLREHVLRFQQLALSDRDIDDDSFE